MPDPDPPTIVTRPAYTPAERLADAVLHVAGLAAALVAAPALVAVAAAMSADGPTLAAASVYGATLVAMFAASAGYHLVRRTDLAEILRRLDHAAIYAKIAGTYTPFTVLLGGDRALPILAGMWSAAGAGMLLKLIAPRRFEVATLALYLAMGWAVVVVGWPIIEALAPHARVLLVTGGLLYTVGVGFHLWDSLPFQNAIWHGFVLVASFVLYAAVLIEILRALPA
jgi:hemolysin III